MKKNGVCGESVPKVCTEYEVSKTSSGDFPLMCTVIIPIWESWALLLKQKAGAGPGGGTHYLRVENRLEGPA